MGRIIDGLNKLGHKVIKTDDIYRGYQSTEHGDRVYTLKVKSEIPLALADGRMTENSYI